MFILIVGKAGSGKSTIAKYISDKYHFKTFSLGDYVKKFLVETSELLGNPIDIHDLYDINKKDKYRHQMQYIATELCRNYFGCNCWCKLLLEKIKQSKEINVIIDDIRFINEMIFFTKNQNDIITIKITKSAQMPNSCQNDDLNHISETELEHINCMYNIINNSTLDDLYKKIDDIMKKY